ncbi:flp pilus-assembly TadE/G-like family protein [Nocardia otitidiscaviarum]|uniref:Flp pilus-assembly TadE/G-like family protein n=1 Tax=Nocardia otitidiscaviarum TaxID=1823 RepID=A0A516NTN9_9NOCA|nr:Rv3654c family TadE-like protein [Nocardia otitidiscaviarum]MCP9621603.1 flp pilus-assembly TadE/G-like family protein [Nocardia otitidiscaviarum]QDP82268.1 flp pilus-assembly TadE/G-like family protein [Nocardia otitidiscaviarum]
MSDVSPARLRADAGSATVTAAWALAALLTVTLLLAQLGVAVVARHEAQSAADLAALAAAGGLDRGTDAGCAEANRVGQRMGVRIRGCVVAGWDVTVTVESGITLGPLGTRMVRASARAGPVVGPG